MTAAEMAEYHRAFAELSTNVHALKSEYLRLQQENERLKAERDNVTRLLRCCAMYSMKTSDSESESERIVHEMAALALEAIPCYVSDQICELECKEAQADDRYTRLVADLRAKIDSLANWANDHRAESVKR